MQLAGVQYTVWYGMSARLLIVVISVPLAYVSSVTDSFMNGRLRLALYGLPIIWVRFNRPRFRAWGYFLTKRTQIVISVP